MAEVHRLVERARRRLQVNDSLAVASWALPTAGWAMLAWIVFTRLLLPRNAPAQFSSLAFLAALGAAVFFGHAALLMIRRGWPSAASAAAQLDERLKLESRMSTALAMQGNRDAFAVAAVEDADRVARDPNVARRLTESFAYRAGHEWRLGAVTVALVALAWLLIPAWTAAGAARDPQAQQDAASEEKAVEAEQRLAESIEIAKEVAGLDESIQKSIEASQQMLDRAIQQPSTPAEREAQAFQQRALLEAAMEKASQSEDLESVDAVKDALAQMPVPQGEEREMMEALKRGDFEAAQKAAQKLADQAKSANPAEAAAAKQALERVAAALSKEGSPAGSAAKQLANALSKSGMDPKLASNPNALQQTLKASKSISPSDQKMIAKLMKLSSQSSKMCNSMCDGAKQAANGNSMNLMDLLKRNAAKSAQGKSLSQCLSSSRSAGGRQAGFSPLPPQQGPGHEAKGFQAEEVMSASQNLDAEPIARDFVQGTATSREEATRTLTTIEHRVEAGLEEGTDEDPVPAQLREAHQRYFSQWKKKIDAAKTGQGQQPAPPNPPAAPPGAR